MPEIIVYMLDLEQIDAVKSLYKNLNARKDEFSLENIPLWFQDAIRKQGKHLDQFEEILSTPLLEEGYLDTLLTTYSTYKQCIIDT